MLLSHTQRKKKNTEKKNRKNYSPQAFLLFASGPLSPQQTETGGYCGHAFPFQIPIKEDKIIQVPVESHFSVTLVHVLMIYLYLEQITCYHVITVFKAFFKNKFIYFFLFLFLAVLGLCCCVRAFSSCGERGLLFVAVCGLLIAVASLVSEHGL